MSLSINQRYNFAIQHMNSAISFAKLCYKTEQENAQSKFGSFFDELRSYVSATVFSTVASLEAYANELFADAKDGFISLADLDTSIINTVWDLSEEKSILDKYQVILSLCGREKLVPSSEPYQSIQTLIRVRNALTHYKPEWGNDQYDHEKIGKQLKGKFKLSHFLGNNDPIFPMRCMSYGCAHWSVNSSINFVAEFSRLAGLENKFDKHLHNLPLPKIE
jgi:hypothetical protein